MTGENHIRSVEIALAQGNTAAAIEAATRGLNANPESLESKLWMGIAFEFNGEHGKALRVFEEAHDEAAKKDVSLHIKGKLKYAYAISLMTTQDFGHAACLLQEAVDIFPNNPRIYESLVKANLKLGATAKAREFGQQAIEIHDQSIDVIAEKLYEPELKRTKLFNASNRKANIIAYSLHGNDSFLQECAFDNARVALDMFPEFTVRIYCDSATPVKVRKELTRFRAELKIVPKPDSEWEPDFWHLWAFDDPSVNVVLARSILAPLSEKEHGLVRKWLFGSTRPFHVIRDSMLHCTPIPENLWGGFTGLLPSMELTVKPLLKKSGSKLSHQHFLLRQIWPRIRGNCLVHDTHYQLSDSVRPQYSGSGPLDRTGKQHPIGWRRRSS